MQQLLDVAALALFVFLVVAFAYVLRRAAGVVAVTRGDETFRRAGAALAERAVAAITPGAERIEGVRRRSAAPAVLEDLLPQILEALDALRVETDALAPPPALVDFCARIAEEIDRAARSIESVQHGCVLLGDAAGRERQLEGETAVKRGYLNLVHAREALASLAAGLRSGGTVSRGWYSNRPRGG
jgi:hypothetical protein